MKTSAPARKQVPIPTSVSSGGGKTKPAGSSKGVVALQLRRPAPESKAGANELVSVVRAGLEFVELEALRAQFDFPMEQLATKLGISRATLHRRKISGRLAPDESDKVVRFARLLGHAVDVFGSVEEARQWLSFQQRGLGGAVPLEYARSEVGAREVENLLGRIQYGVYS